MGKDIQISSLRKLVNDGVRSWVKLSDVQVQVNISIMPLSLGSGQNQMKVLLRLQKNTQMHDAR